MDPIRIYGDPVLRTKAEPLSDFNDALEDLIERMKEDMYDEDGIGLAAPQIGESVRLIITDHTAGEQEPMVFVNPEITWFSEEKSDYDEGCLSIPGINVLINRPSSISVKAQDIEGKEFVLDHIEGLLARVIQHEIDHLDGILFVDRASVTRRALINGKLKKLAKENKK